MPKVKKESHAGYVEHKRKLIKKNASIIAIGSEIMNGQIQDRHSQFIAKQLARYSVTVSRMTQLPDEQNLIVKEIKNTITNFDIIFITGGLGPTSDDITRDCVAQATGKQLVFDKQLWEKIDRKVAGRARGANRQQACYPQGFTPLNNDWGTAPGFYAELPPLIMALPGPARELQPIFNHSVIPLLNNFLDQQATEERAVTAFAIGESQLEEGLREVAKPELDNWRTKFEPERILFYLPTDKKKSDTIIEKLQRRFSPVIVKEGEQQPAAGLLDQLRKRDMKLATAESCSGGGMASCLTAVAGASDSYWGGWVSYRTEAKKSALHVSDEILLKYGAVSQQTAEAMARGALLGSGSDIAASITGLAGPTDDGRQPIGSVVIAIADKKGFLRSFPLQLRGDRQRIARRSAIIAVLLTELAILSSFSDKTLDNFCKLI